MSSFDPPELSGLSDHERRLLPRYKRRVTVIAEDEAGKHQDFQAAYDASIARLHQEYGSILGAILLAILCKIIAEAVWALLKKRWPDKFTAQSHPEVGGAS